MFKDVENPPAEEAPAEGDEGAKPEGGAKPAEQEKMPHSVYIKEVVREPRMHFFKVPKLGSYLAIRLEYNSCLFEEALDAGVVDYLDVRQKVKEQEEEKKSFIEKQKGAEEEGDGEPAASDGVASSRQWDQIKPKPFKSKKVQFVVCLNTLGQDREFTSDQIKFAQRTVRDFASQWEKIEHHNLEQDIFLRIASIEHDAEYKKLREPADN